MDDLISRQAAIDIFDDYNIAVESGEIESYRHYREQLVSLPSVHRNTGEWAGNVCTACGESTNFYYDFHYCPWCGAKGAKKE